MPPLCLVAAARRHVSIYIRVAHSGRLLRRRAGDTMPTSSPLDGEPCSRRRRHRHDIRQPQGRACLDASTRAPQSLATPCTRHIAGLASRSRRDAETREAPGHGARALRVPPHRATCRTMSRITRRRRSPAPPYAPRAARHAMISGARAP